MMSASALRSSSHWLTSRKLAACHLMSRSFSSLRRRIRRKAHVSLHNRQRALIRECRTFPPLRSKRSLIAYLSSPLPRHRNPVGIEGSDYTPFGGRSTKFMLPFGPVCVTDGTFPPSLPHRFDLRACVNRQAGWRSAGNSLRGGARGGLPR